MSFGDNIPSNSLYKHIIMLDCGEVVVVRSPLCSILCISSTNMYVNCTSRAPIFVSEQSSLERTYVQERNSWNESLTLLVTSYNNVNIYKSLVKSIIHSKGGGGGFVRFMHLLYPTPAYIPPATTA